MKNPFLIFSIFIFGIFFCTSRTFAQYPMANVLSTSTDGINYERVLSNRVSVEFSIPFSYGYYTDFQGNNSSFFGYGFGGEVRFYLLSHKLAPRGFYIAPGAYYEYASSTYNSTYLGASSSLNYNFTVVRAVIGHQWIGSSGYSFNVYGGIGNYQYNYGNNNDLIQGIQNQFSTGNGISPIVGIGVGYAF